MADTGVIIMVCSIEYMVYGSGVAEHTGGLLVMMRKRQWHDDHNEEVLCRAGCSSHKVWDHR